MKHFLPSGQFNKSVFSRGFSQTAEQNTLLLKILICDNKVLWPKKLAWGFWETRRLRMEDQLLLQGQLAIWVIALRINWYNLVKRYENHLVRSLPGHFAVLSDFWAHTTGGASQDHQGCQGNPNQQEHEVVIKSCVTKCMEPGLETLWG